MVYYVSWIFLDLILALQIEWSFNLKFIQIQNINQSIFETIWKA
jgi:hypothetical protein